MASNDDILASGTVGNPGNGNPIGLVYMQLKLITIILKQAFDITDEDWTLLQAPVATLNPNTPSQIANE